MQDGADRVSGDERQLAAPPWTAEMNSRVPTERDGTHDLNDAEHDQRDAQQEPEHEAG